MCLPCLLVVAIQRPRIGAQRLHCTLKVLGLHTVMLGDALVERDDWCAFGGAFQSERNFVSRGQISPAEHLLVLLIEVRLALVPEWHLLRRLSVYESVSEDHFFSLELCRDIDPRSPLAVGAPERVLIESEGERANSTSRETVLEILQLLDESRFDFKIWSA